MAKWKLSKHEDKDHDGGTETVTLGATITLQDGITLEEVAELIGNLTTVDGIPITAVVGNPIDVALRWEPAP